jgi:hypothetical protein
VANVNHHFYGTIRTMARKKKDGVKRMTVELEDAIHAQLAILSEREGRSIHGQILYLIRRAIEQGAKRRP